MLFPEWRDQAITAICVMHRQRHLRCSPASLLINSIYSAFECIGILI